MNKIFSIDRYTTAAKVYLELEDTQNAIQCLINGKEWNKAKKLAREMEPSLLRKIEQLENTITEERAAKKVILLTTN